MSCRVMGISIVLGILSWVHKFGKMFDTWDEVVFWYATATDELKLQPAKQAQQSHEGE